MTSPWGRHFHLLAARLERGMSFDNALQSTPRFLPPQVTAMLNAGQQVGDLRKVLPACRELLKDGVSQTRGALNYLVILTLVITPLGAWSFGAMETIILPKFEDISASTSGGNITGIAFLSDHAAALLTIQIGLLLLVWHAVFLYIRRAVRGLFGCDFGLA